MQDAGRSQKAFIPVTGDVMRCHFRGEDRIRPSGPGEGRVAGIDPQLFDDTCRFLAIDFDRAPRRRVP